MSLNLAVRMHPMVLFQIVDSYERRKADSLRVIGTLLGNVENGIVEVTNCFCVPHKESDTKVEVDLAYGMDLYDLNRRVNAQEQIVGWWATGNKITAHSSVIHEYYALECNNPVHLTVDTTLTNTTRLAIKAYVCVPLGVPGSTQGSIFTPVNVQITSYEPELIGLRQCSKTLPHLRASGIKSARELNPIMDFTRISEACSNISVLMEQVLAYINDVLTSKRLPNNQVGRTLFDMIHSMPKLTSEQFNDMYNGNIRELLMIVALSHLMQIQVQLNEKLTLLKSL